MIKIHLHESKSKKEIDVLKDNPELESSVQISVKRSWQHIIKLLQTEDESGNKTQFRSIPQFVNYNESSCFTWIIFAIMSSCKEIWEIVDTKDTPFK